MTSWRKKGNVIFEIIRKVSRLIMQNCSRCVKKTLKFNKKKKETFRVGSELFPTINMMTFEIYCGRKNIVYILGILNYLLVAPVQRFYYYVRCKIQI